MKTENATHHHTSVYINGNLLTEDSSCTVKRESGSNPVKTVAKGYAGESPGAAMTNITVKSAVPSIDFEFNPGPFMNRNESVEVTVFAAGKTLSVTGFILEDNFNECAKDVSIMLALSFRGGESEWES